MNDFTLEECYKEEELMGTLTNMTPRDAGFNMDAEKLQQKLDIAIEALEKIVNNNNMTADMLSTIAKNVIEDMDDDIRHIGELTEKMNEYRIPITRGVDLNRDIIVRWNDAGTGVEILEKIVRKV